MSANTDDTDTFYTINMCASSVVLWSFAISACIDALKQTICIGNSAIDRRHIRAAELWLFTALVGRYFVPVHQDSTPRTSKPSVHCDEPFLQLSCYCVNCDDKDVDAESIF